jgi:hypothetical protein
MSVELTARLEQFLAALQLVYKHNGPITAAYVKELSEIVNLYRHGSR